VHEGRPDTTDEGLSFDPRTWRTDDRRIATIAPSITAAGQLSRFAFALIGSLLILTAGGLTAWLARPSTPPSYTAPTP
jgi:hypothetical protein